MKHLKHSAKQISEPDPELRVGYQSLLMGHKSGKQWANTYQNRPFPPNNRVGELSFNESAPMFDRIYSIIETKKKNTVQTNYI